MNPPIFLIAVLAVASFLSVAQTASASPRQTRQLVFYGTNEPSDILKLRQWVWDKWSHRVASSAVLKWNTTEGDSGTSDYSTCNDKEGAWCLATHLQGSDSLAVAITYWRHEWTLAYSTERIE